MLTNGGRAAPASRCSHEAHHTASWYPAAVADDGVLNALSKTPEP